MRSGETLRQRSSETLTIGQLAGETGISATTIRYYESIGLLPRPPRGDNQYRRYGQADVNRLRLLSRIRTLGAPLSLAKPLMEGASDARCAEVQRELLALVEKRLRALDEEIAELERLRSDVQGYQRRLEACDMDTTASFSACADASCLALPGEQDGECADDEEPCNDQCDEPCGV